MKSQIQTLFIAIAVLFNYSLLPVWAAGSVSVTTSSKSTVTKFNASADINKVGNLMSDDLMAIMDDAEVRIEKKDDKGRRITLLSGVIWKKSIVGKKLVSNVYFRDGRDLESALGDTSEEAVIKTGDKTYCGKIIDIDARKVVLEDLKTREKVTLQNSSIESINSRRCFDVSMLITGADVASPSLDLAFTARVRRANVRTAYNRRGFVKARTSYIKPDKPVASNGAGMSPVAKVVVVTIGLVLIATAIAVPIAVGVTQANANRRRRNRNRQADNIQLFNFINQQQQPNQNQNQNN